MLLYMPFVFYGMFAGFNSSFMNRSLAINYVSFINTNVAIILSTSTLFGWLPYYYMRYWLTSYFLYDSLMVMQKPSKLKIIDFVFLLHHVLSIISLQQREHSSIISKLFLVAETSNWPMYVVKHYIENGNQEMLQLWKKIQFGVYAPLRILGIGSFFLLVENAWYMKLVGSPIFLMGVVWSYKLWQKL